MTDDRKADVYEHVTAILSMKIVISLFQVYGNEVAAASNNQQEEWKIFKPIVKLLKFYKNIEDLQNFLTLSNHSTRL